MVLGEALQRWAACLGVHSRGACTLAAGDAWMGLALLGMILAAAYTGRKLVTTAVMRFCRRNTTTYELHKG